jgi:adenylate kinase family enzyme
LNRRCCEKINITAIIILITITTSCTSITGRYTGATRTNELEQSRIIIAETRVRDDAITKIRTELEESLRDIESNIIRADDSFDSVRTAINSYRELTKSIIERLRELENQGNSTEQNTDDWNNISDSDDDAKSH